MRSVAYEAVSSEAGTNETLSHSFCAMALAIKTLDVLRDTSSEAKSVEVAHV
jgi:hypothetical protein